MGDKGFRVGLIGGLSFQSSNHYNKAIHEYVQQTLGGQHSTELVQVDVNFEWVVDHMEHDRWNLIGERLASIAEVMVKSFGVEKVAIASNTIHRVASRIVDQIGSVRFLHIADCVAQACLEEIAELNQHHSDEFAAKHARRVLLLGTEPTMSQPEIVRQRLEQQGLEIVVPKAEAQQRLHQIIFGELCHGQRDVDSVEWYQRMICEAIQDNGGVAGIILGCTELSMLIDPFALSHTKGYWEYNHDQPFVVVDSAEAHIKGIAKAYLNLNK